jgi:ribose/xylose/arabinose/galactoside ABC-type transport system permease subunit
MNPMEIIALVISILTLLKIIVFLFNPRWLMKLVESMHKYIVLQAVSVSIFILALGAYLVMFLGVVNLIVASLFGMMTFALVLLMSPKLYLKFGKDIIKNRKALIPVFLIWGVLSVWTLWTLFG